MGTAHQKSAVVARHDQVSRGVAFAAMAGAVHQIGAAIPAWRLAGIGLPGGGIQAQKFPQAKSPAQQEGNGYISLAPWRGNGRQTHEVGLDIQHIANGHGRIGGVGEGRNEMLAGFGNAALHGIDEVEVRPVSNAGLRIRGQVRGVQNADGGFEGEAAAWQIGVKPGLFGIWLVAIPAATGGIENFAIGDVGGMGGDCRGRQVAVERSKAKTQ